MTAPKRRWFRLGLPTMVVVVTVAACVVWWTKDLWVPLNLDEKVAIATVGDPDTAIAIRELLKENGIESEFEGSLTYTVCVTRREAPRACKLIRDAGRKLGPYQNWIADY